jgi:mRNA-degrading endonuclease toxin of MazEF toxin-antitoxin module
VLIVSADAFNRHNAPIVCPITHGGNASRLAGLVVSLASTPLKTQGVVLCSQIRVLDIKARGGKKVETVPDFVIDEVLACLQDLLE